MESGDFFYRIYSLETVTGKFHYCGTAFPVTPNGNYLTCNHVVEQAEAKGNSVAIVNNNTKELIVVNKILRDVANDLAVLINPFNEIKCKFFPIIQPDTLTIGEDVYTYGFYKDFWNSDIVHNGYFKGHLVNFSPTSLASNSLSATISFPIIEGLSGSPLLTYHNGPKLVGLNLGNIQQRIQQSVVMEYTSPNKQFQEVTSRIIEHGISLHPSVIIDTLQNLGITNYLCTNESFDIESE